jgi:uncharacterized protein YmfQ (DUF2313 family)
MAIKFAATTNAVNRGLENAKPESGAHLIEDWETALADLDIPGVKGIQRDLAALRKQVESDKPNSDRIHAILHRLGEATVKISDKADKNGDKIKALGEALIEAGEPSHDEEEDKEAAAAPKRKRTKKS